VKQSKLTLFIFYFIYFFPTQKPLEGFKWSASSKIRRRRRNPPALTNTKTNTKKTNKQYTEKQKRKTYKKILEKNRLNKKTKHKMKNKTTTLVMGMLILGILMLSFASADCISTFTKGQKEIFCNPAQDRTCGSTTCQVCMGSYNATKGCYNSGSSNGCNNGGYCTGSNGNSTNNNTFDLSPPIFNISSPLNGTIFNSTKLSLKFSLNEVATVYYKDVKKNTNMWIKVCDKCSVGNPSYSSIRSFSEGENNLMFKAVDMANPPNTAYVSVKFFVDSVAPRIYTTTPTAGDFADGNFEVQFKETNAKRVTLTYGTDKVNLNLSKCYNSTSDKKICDINVNLSKYNGQKILYSFEVEDIAGSTYKSKPTNVSIDIKAPVVNNPSSFFKVNGRYVDFNISITEPNFDKVVFIKTTDSRATQTTLCTRLVNGYCTKHQSFIKGNYSLSIQITDKAGNAIALPASFKIA